jgi:hypothetical protein
MVWIGRSGWRTFMDSAAGGLDYPRPQRLEPAAVALLRRVRAAPSRLGEFRARDPHCAQLLVGLSGAPLLMTKDDTLIVLVSSSAWIRSRMVAYVRMSASR